MEESPESQMGSLEEKERLFGEKIKRLERRVDAGRRASGGGGSGVVVEGKAGKEETGTPIEEKLKRFLKSVDRVEHVDRDGHVIPGEFSLGAFADEISEQQKVSEKGVHWAQDSEISKYRCPVLPQNPVLRTLAVLFLIGSSMVLLLTAKEIVFEKMVQKYGEPAELLPGYDTDQTAVPKYSTTTTTVSTVSSSSILFTSTQASDVAGDDEQDTPSLGKLFQKFAVQPTTSFKHIHKLLDQSASDLTDHISHLTNKKPGTSGPDFTSYIQSHDNLFDMIKSALQNTPSTAPQRILSSFAQYFSFYKSSTNNDVISLAQAIISHLRNVRTDLVQIIDSAEADKDHYEEEIEVILKEMRKKEVESDGEGNWWGGEKERVLTKLDAGWNAERAEGLERQVGVVEEFQRRVRELEGEIEGFLGGL